MYNGVLTALTLTSVCTHTTLSMCCLKKKKLKMGVVDTQCEIKSNQFSG